MKCFVALAVLVVLQVCFTGVKAADGDVNAACASGNTCTQSTDTCDSLVSPSAQCKTKAGQNCVATGDCITNAACTSNGAACTCSANYVATSDNTKCLLKVDQTCTASTQCLENGECTGSPLKCACKSGYTKSGDSCVSGATGLGVSISMLFLVFLTTRLL